MTALVDQRREQLLAGTGLSQDQDRRIGGGHLLDLLEHATYCGALSDDRALAKPFLDLLTEIDIFELQSIAQSLHFGERALELELRLLLFRHVDAGTEIAA